MESCGLRADQLVVRMTDKYSNKDKTRPPEQRGVQQEPIDKEKTRDEWWWIRSG